MADIGSVLEAAFGEPTPLSFDANLASWCERARKELIEYEVMWSDPEWTFLRQMEAHMSALDALREAVQGCGENYIQELGCYGLRTLCSACQDKRDAAVARLLGSEIEGDTDGSLANTRTGSVATASESSAPNALHPLIPETMADLRPHTSPARGCKLAP